MTFLEAKNSKSDMKEAFKEKWKELLEIEDEIENDVSFFDVGGNSLTAGILFSNVEEQLGIKINVSDIYENDTVDALTDFTFRLLEKSAESSK